MPPGWLWRRSYLRASPIVGPFQHPLARNCALAECGAGRKSLRRTSLPQPSFAAMAPPPKRAGRPQVREAHLSANGGPRRAVFRAHLAAGPGGGERSRSEGRCFDCGADNSQRASAGAARVQSQPLVLQSSRLPVRSGTRLPHLPRACPRQPPRVMD